MGPLCHVELRGPVSFDSGRLDGVPRRWLHRAGLARTRRPDAQERDLRLGLRAIPIFRGGGALLGRRLCRRRPGAARGARCRWTTTAAWPTCGSRTTAAGSGVAGLDPSEGAIDGDALGAQSPALAISIGRTPSVCALGREARRLTVELLLSDGAFGKLVPIAHLAAAR